MLQREVADRLAAAPGTKAYGPLTLAVQLRAAARRLFTVPPAAFHPRPAVASAVVVLAPHGLPPVPPAQWPAVEIVVRAAFGRRRKMLRQALAGPGTGLAPAGAAAALGAAGIDGRRRGETLSLEEFHRLASVMATSRAGAGP
jgi:16S rRNA (adenine1518-N6/adenine1519-N6)-dimethyltransferase